MTTSATPINRFPYWDTAEDFDAITGQESGSPMFDEEEEDEIIGDFNRENRSMTRKLVVKGTGKIQGPVRLITGAPEAVNGYKDSNQIQQEPIRKIREGFAKGTGKGVEEAAYHAVSPFQSLEERFEHDAQQIHHDPDASAVTKVGSKVVHGTVYVARRTVMAPISMVEAGSRWAVRGIGRFFRLFDEVEDESIEVAGQERNIGDNSRNAVFGSTPETLSPLNLDSAMVTDAYQHQNTPGADLIAGEANQGMDSYQAQGGRYEVLA